MDAYKATDTIMSRIRSIDPENASRISGYVLMNVDEKELIRIALGPDALLLSYINQAKVYLSGLGSSKSLNPKSARLLQETSPRIVMPDNGFHLSSPFPPSAAASAGPNSYASVLNASNIVDGLDSSFYGSTELNDSLFWEVGKAISSPRAGNPLHRRSYSVNDAAVFEGGDDADAVGFESSRLCMYFVRGFCKKGSSCKFIHSEEMRGDNKLLTTGSFSYHKRNIDLPTTAANSSERQIYLTFPSDSTFKEEDVSSYFSTFGPVQDVRIPYQQKRMFGFVTFVYPETVKQILAKRNPHFVCDSRVLVKPYKEKGKIPDKKQLQQHLSLSRIDSREVFSVPVGPRVLLNNTQEIMLRRKLEQEAEVQHAIERRMMNLQLMDASNLQHNNSRFLSPRQASLLMRQNLNAASDGIDLENYQEFDTGHRETSTNNTVSGNNNHQRVNDNDLYTLESLGLILSDSHCASPSKLAAETRPISLQSSAGADHCIMPVTSKSPNNSS